MTDANQTQEMHEKQVILDLASLNVASEEIEKYGVHPDQFIEWYGVEGGRVIVLVHGGLISADASLSYLRPAALALGEAGYRVALVEYRRGARHPEISFEDIATLTRHKALQDATWCGHSIGAIFILNALFNPENSVKHCVGIAPVMDLRREAESKDTPMAETIIKWLGGSPSYIPDIYAEYDPAVRYAQIGNANGFSAQGYHLDIIHGTADMTVPVQHTKDFQSEPFNIAIVPDADHGDVVLPGQDAWLFLLGALG